MANKCDGLSGLYVIQDSNKYSDDNYVLDKLIMESLPQVDEKEDDKSKNRN
jgi:hypothetical protein